MGEEEKERYKDQSKGNRDQYEQKRKEFDSMKMCDPDSSRLNVIQGIQERRVSRQKQLRIKQEAEQIQAEEEEIERVRQIQAKIEKRQKLQQERDRLRDLKTKEKDTKRRAKLEAQANQSS